MPSTRRDFLRAGSCAAGVAMSGHAASASVGESNNGAMKQHLLRCLGGDWPAPVDLRPTLERREQRDGVELQWIRYQVEPDEMVGAIVLVPAGVSAQSPAPAIAVWHQHAGQWHLGKSEPAGLAGNPMHHTGLALAKLGYVVLCPDALCFEERQDPSGQLAGGDYERFEFLRYVVQGQCMAWKNILDMRRAIDYLVTRDDVQHHRIGCYGHSMGSTHTWLVGPWEPRLRCLVGNCCLPTYAAIHRTEILHCFPNFIPGWQAHGDTPDIAAMIAPRALHLNLGETDSGSPIQEARAGIDTIAAAYAAAGAEGQFTWWIEPETGHVLSDTMWERTRETFEKHLRSG